ncbi:MAG: tetratricopeptide repeat protein [Planctomycetota bacterium]|jgi:hypothetical protein|nr:tetratricopeptide repeat protein [Planctomycetota bacterium]MDA1200268.1 tetratricopeptide repeat protein [Planctomycetota bacterium]
MLVALRSLTLVWPGLPWLWLRGSMAGLVLAVAFAITLDVAIVTTFIWPGLVELPLTIGCWTAAGLVWLASTVSALAAFPAALASPPPAEVDPLFIRARDAYLARDWLTAEVRLREVLDASPTDGEAQLLLGTLLRRVGRLDEAATALEKLAASDSGIRWRQAIAAEQRRVVAARQAAGGNPVPLPLADEPPAEVTVEKESGPNRAAA